MGRPPRLAFVLPVALVVGVAAVATITVRADPQAPPAPASPRPAPSARPPAASPAPLPILEGTVVGPDGKPVAGALVSVQPAAVSFGFGEQARTARTDAGGRFRVPVKTTGVHMLRVEAMGLAARTLPRVRPGDSLRVALDKGGSIEGIVRDGGTGAPAAAIVVEARPDLARGVGMVWERGAGIVRATTDAKGLFRLEGLAPGTHTLVARGRGLTAQRRSVAIGKRAELYLFPGGGLDGTVSGADGRAVAGATVAIEPAIPFGMRVATDVEVTDARGRFQFLGIDPGLYRLVARHPDFAPGWTAITVERGSDARAEVALAPPASIVGRILGAADRPLPGRVTVVEVDGAAPPVSIAPLLLAEAGADGRFRVEAAPPGDYVLAVTAPGYGTRRAEVSVAGVQRTADAGDIVLESGLVIRGRVREAGGAPIADARLMAFRDRPMGDDRGEARTDADGTFAIGGLHTGTYRVTATAPGRGTTDREVEAGTDGVDFVLDAAGSLTGLVVDERGRPVETFRVNARMPPAGAASGRVMMGPPRFEAVSSPDGRFLLDDVAPGTYVVEVSAPERATATVSNIKVSPGAATDVGRVQLGAGGIVRGTVADTAGAPVPAAVVTFQGVGRTFGFGSAIAEAVTDSAGVFELRGVPSGPVQVIGRHPQFAEGRATAEVDPAKEAPEVRIVLLQGGRIEGRARRRDGAAVIGAVNVFSRRGGPAMSPSSLTPISPDGTFVVEHVPAGTVTVMLMEGSGGLLTSGKQREVEVQEGQTSAVEFVARDILVTGRVTRGGTAVPNLRLRASGDQFGMVMMYSSGAAAPPGAGPQRMAAVTREDGGYEMLVDEPGKGSIRIENLDGTVTYPPQRVEFPDADSFSLDLALPVASITGVVVERETDQPVPRANVFAASVPPQTNVRPSFSNAMAGPDGRFRLEVEPGEYKVSARAEGLTGESVTVTVAESSAADVRVALTRGVAIRGRVVDTRGQPVGGLQVVAVSSNENAPGFGGAMTMADGTFEIGGLTAATYNLTARSDLGFFAVRSGVSAGTEDVTLTLRRGGRVIVTALGPDGAPVRGAYVMVRRVSGTTSSGINGLGPTDARGITELNVPVGSVELRVIKDEALEGSATAPVAEGATVPVEVTLGPSKGTPPAR